MQQLVRQLNSLVLSMVDNKRIFGVVLRVESGDGQLLWDGAAGNMSSTSRFFIASTTKLYVTAVLLKLRELNKIKLNDKISLYLDKSILLGIHCYKGQRYRIFS